MKTINEIKDEKSARIDQLTKDCLVFFAFSKDQFEENKTPLEEGEKYVSMGMGGYLPKGKVKEWIKGMEDIEKWFKATIKDNKARKDHIVYELANHEAFYTGEIEDTLSALGSDYTKDEVLAVYRSEGKKHRVEF